MTEDSSDMALAALLAVAREVAPDLPEDLLRKTYAIQRAHQFDHDRTVSLQAMQRLVEEYVNASTLRPGDEDSGA